MERSWFILVLFFLSVAFLPIRAADFEDHRYPSTESLPDVETESRIVSPLQPVFASASFLSSLNSRARVIQASIIVMCLALFILMKKFAETGSVRCPSSVVRGKEQRTSANVTTDDIEQRTTDH